MSVGPQPISHPTFMAHLLPAITGFLRPPPGPPPGGGLACVCGTAPGVEGAGTRGRWSRRSPGPWAQPSRPGTQGSRAECLPHARHGASAGEAAAAGVGGRVRGCKGDAEVQRP